MGVMDFLLVRNFPAPGEVARVASSVDNRSFEAHKSEKRKAKSEKRTFVLSSSLVGINSLLASSIVFSSSSLLSLQKSLSIQKTKIGLLSFLLFFQRLLG